MKIYCLVTNHFFFIELVNQNIFFVSDLFNAQGNLLSFPDFVSLKAAKISLRDYNKVIKSIPVSLEMLFKAHLYYGSIIYSEFESYIDGSCC